ncbi:MULTISPECIES: PAS domain-containing sensor histidine kinase [unclassified Robiginitalea]|uniref:PAS domain-containing sensor histidine kinase n=1 Tax=Robiginitalea TaxID=252306 RepID=UPI0023497560|nr:MULTISPECIES: PAS domain-containing protein [unclassified Robiginitalea]MDC6354693.1 PAS domain-containing protein [Robiginitalea sp. PM2]MDC6374625.1 PAS domain-containing protein [Robiginitalea sp. SP8]
MKETQVHAQSFLISQIPSPTAFLNRDLEVVHASDTFIETFHFDKKNLFGRRISEVLPQAPEHLIGVMQRCLKGTDGKKGIDRFVTSDNEEHWYESSNTPWYDKNENVIGVILQITNITDRIQKELQYEKTQILLEAKAVNARIGSWEYNAFTEKLCWCPMTRKIHEVPDDYEPTIDDGIEFYKEGYSRNAISMAVYKAMETGQPWKEKLKIVSRTGKELWVIATGKPLYKDDIYIGLIGTIQDVTEANISHQRSTESENLLRTVVDNLPLNVYIKDLESRKILVNKAECAYLGVSDADELLGKSDFELYNRQIAQESRDEDLFVLNNGTPLLGKETISVRKDGKVTHFLSSKIPLFDEDGEVYGLLGLSMDISDLKQKESELRQLIDVSSQQNKKLVNFAHIVSHNLRSHSANFSMLLDFLSSEPDGEERNRILGMLNNASDNLLETLENLNEVIAINTNVRMEKKEVRLYRAVHAAQQHLSEFLKSHNAKVFNEIPPEAVMRAIPTYLDSILINFITNGVKYRHPERVPEVRLSYEKSGGQDVLVISDNGLGIDLKKYGDKLFGMYKTFHNHPEARGIGLYITKNQVEAMNGRIQTSSTVGEGTIFKIFLDEQG